LIGLYNKTWLITGGSGFLGQQLTKDILEYYQPKSIRIYSRGEAKQAEMQAKFNDERLRFIIGDVKNEAHLTKAMQGVDICVHAAALKRIDTCEANPIECIEVNIIGTVNVCSAALANKIACLLYVSTDKAKLPDTTYGMSKAMAENVVRNAFHYKGNEPIQFKAVRYGNILGSTGSVLTIWDRQSKANEPITVTDKDMTRFFMTVNEASKLIIDTIATGAENTEHSLAMKSVNIYKLAKYLYPKAKIKITGTTSKEKVHEDLYDGYNSKDVQVEPKELLKGYQLCR